MIRAAIVVVLGIGFWIGACLGGAFGHEPHQGHKTPYGYGADYFLHGKALIATPYIKKGSIMNCCLFGGSGDCFPIPPSALKVEEGPNGEEGFRLPDGEWIAKEDASLSPDGTNYRCQKRGMPSHCLFYTESRG